MNLFYNVLFSAVFISLAGSTSAQDIYFTISGEYDGSKISLDSILFENLSNENVLIIDSLQDQDQYIINLSTQVLIDPTGIDPSGIFTGFYVMKCIPGQLIISYSDFKATDVSLTINNINGQVVYSKPLGNLKGNGAVDIHFGGIGFYLVSLRSSTEIQSFKAIGSDRGHGFTHTLSGQNSVKQVQLKSTLIPGDNGFSVAVGDSIMTVAYKAGYYASPIVLKVNSTNQLDFVFVEDTSTIPTILTNDITATTDTSALVGGNVTNDGGATVLETGVYWGTSLNPETTGTKLAIGNEAGEFSTTLNNLDANTTYYIKAYARNLNGEALGEEKSFTTPENTEKYSFLKINDVEYELSDAFIDGESIVLLSPDHKINWDSFELTDTAAVGAIMYFDITNSADSIENRTYSITPWEDMCREWVSSGIDLNGDGIINELDYYWVLCDGVAYISADYSFYSGSYSFVTEETEFEFQSGTVVIILETDHLMLEFEGIGKNGDLVTGYFSDILRNPFLK